MPKKPPTKKRAAREQGRVRTTKTTPKKEVISPVKPIDTSWHERFLEILGTTCNVTLASNVAGVDKGTAYDHKARFPEFAEKWKEAKESAIELLEAEAWQRARKTSDTLLIFLLKAHKPEKYRESIDVNLKKLSDEELIARVTGALGGDGAAGADASGAGGERGREGAAS